ncbi:hypothetical protein TRFO_11154 [Tritrichomonas foetus]|uniref:Endoplasmic reticulum-Golgi intermediate compartment protein 3 n=1 Tax=Tritrichomonas foetus TaxID=1144522 RepID=A0A1J4JAQ2_9EUKA|nr:hypothetical protein TRFO_11154 [Tritrichomonas foetus]|eukprot:OHS94509.1 hypothetical protein TRFO_11154 [Tritrichomonas foetus]
MKKSRLRKFIKRLDLYPKISVDVRKKTPFGGIVAILSFFSIITIFYFIIRNVIFAPPIQKFFVNTNLIPTTFDRKINESAIPKMRINFDISLFHLPCALTRLEILDINKESISNFDGKVRMQRYNSAGQPIFEKYYPKNEIPESGYCGPCYSLKQGCCNTCKEVRELFKSHSKPMPAIATIEQCSRGNYTNLISSMINESCRIHGTVTVKQHPGHIVISPGYAISNEDSPNQKSSIYDELNLNLDEFNLSHQIHHFGFGTGMNERHATLDGNLEIQHFQGRMKMYYYLRIVPIGTDGVSFAYGSSSMLRYRNENTTQLPSIFFNYDISPIAVIKERNINYSKFIAQLTSVIGGIFALATFIDSFTNLFLNFVDDETLPKAE